jgi:dipeptidyl aminopeptidase/acylaminoacyl peptidase
MRSIPLTLFVSCALLTAAPKVPTIDQSLEFHAPANPRISPDGRYIAYEVQSADWEENVFKSEIWIAPVASPHDRYQLTRGKKSSSRPEWSPDSRRLAFSSDRDGKKQIYLISPAGGEAQKLTEFETDVGAFKWSPDGRTIAFVAADPEGKPEKDRKEKFGEFEIVRNDYTRSHLWLIQLPDAGAKPKPERLTTGTDFSVGSFAWSPDSTRIAFNATPDPSPASGGNSDIYVIQIADKGAKKIVTTNGPDRNPVWSPDGARIAYETADAQEFFYYANSRLAVVPAEGGTPRIVGAEFDEDPGLESWSPAGIYFDALQKTYAHLFRLDPASGKTSRLSGPDRAIYSQFSFTKDFARTAFIGSPAGGFSEIYTSRLEPFDPVAITSFGDQAKDFHLAARQVISWKSKDGAAIEGVLIKPADFDPSKKYPLLVVIHGGPTGVSQAVRRADRYYPLEMFAAKGALILMPNYRGSAGYGANFRALNVRNLGVGDAWDVLSGVDYLIAQGSVDPALLGAMGWSQGGYISAFLTTSSDRFKAISVGAGISDWSTYYVNTDISPFTRQYLHATPWDDPEIYRKTSPISYIKSAKTPTLIQHGELDKRVPIPNAYELRQALEDRGVPVKMIVYKGFGHGIDKPKQQRAVMQHNYEWFSRWIWGEKTD